MLCLEQSWWNWKRLTSVAQSDDSAELVVPEKKNVLDSYLFVFWSPLSLLSILQRSEIFSLKPKVFAVMLRLWAWVKSVEKTCETTDFCIAPWTLPSLCLAQNVSRNRLITFFLLCRARETTFFFFFNVDKAAASYFYQSLKKIKKITTPLLSLPDQAQTFSISCAAQLFGHEPKKSLS